MRDMQNRPNSLRFDAHVTVLQIAPEEPVADARDTPTDETATGVGAPEGAAAACRAAPFAGERVLSDKQTPPACTFSRDRARSFYGRAMKDKNDAEEAQGPGTRGPVSEEKMRGAVLDEDLHAFVGFEIGPKNGTVEYRHEIKVPEIRSSTQAHLRPRQIPTVGLFDKSIRTVEIMTTC